MCEVLLKINDIRLSLTNTYICLTTAYGRSGIPLMLIPQEPKVCMLTKYLDYDDVVTFNDRDLLSTFKTGGESEVCLHTRIDDRLTSVLLSVSDARCA